MAVAGERGQGLAGVVAIARLAVDPAAERDDRVDTEDGRPRALRRHRRSLAVGVLDRDLVRRPLLELLHVRRVRVELDPEAREDLTPLRRARREDQARLGKNSPTSRLADAVESEPWTMFCPTAIA